MNNIECDEKVNQELKFYKEFHDQVLNSKSWEITAPLHSFVRKMKHGVRKIQYKLAPKSFCVEGFDRDYYFQNNPDVVASGMDPLEHYVLYGRKEGRYKSKNDGILAKIRYLDDFYLITDDERKREKKETFSKNIKFSILVPLYNTPLDFLREMIESVQHQTYSNWELCLADGSDNEHVQVGEYVQKVALQDKRILHKKLERNLGISENTNACIDLATGDYVGFFDHDDLLHPSALYECMKVICDRGADFVYTDEATFISENGQLTTVNYKPDFAIDNLRGINYICHFSVFSKYLLDKVGRFNSEYDGSQDHDMILRLTEQAHCIVHIPKILYFWRAHDSSVAQNLSSKQYAVDAGIRAVQASLNRAGLAGIVESSSWYPSVYRIKYSIKCMEKVSIIIPTKNHYVDLKKCLDSVFWLTTYSNYEIIIIDNGSDEQQLFAYYDELKKRKNVSIYHYDAEFNYSKINNFAVTKAIGKYLILLNNDTEVITPEWIEEMLMYAQRDDVGAVGAKLYYPDDTIQHGGVILGIGGVAGHAFKYFHRSDPGYICRLGYAQDYSAVTAACMMVKASVYREIHGFDENFKVAFNDVDLCMRIRKADYLIVWTPYAELYHHESKSRGLEDTLKKKKRFEGEKLRFKDRWAKELAAGDPYYNPNLTLDREDFSFK